MSEKMERDDNGPDQYACDNCGEVYTFEQLGWIQSYGERVSAGNPAPAGECPDEDCGALCYPVTPPAAPAAAESQDQPYTVIGVFLGSHKTIIQQVKAAGVKQAWDAAMEAYVERDAEAYSIIAILAGHPELVYHEATL